MFYDKHLFILDAHDKHSFFLDAQKRDSEKYLVPGRNVL